VNAVWDDDKMTDAVMLSIIIFFEGAFNRGSGLPVAKLTSNDDTNGNLTVRRYFILTCVETRLQITGARTTACKNVQEWVSKGA
jgi:hypothetical protein